jgi:lipopolysaccharide transport protein LptA
MASSSDRLRILAAAILMSALTTAAAQDDSEPISLDAESSLFDRQTNRVEFRQLTISQGEMSISADEAVASGLDFEQGEWRLTGNVTFMIESARISADTALMTFVDNELETAELVGDPATLEDLGDPEGDPDEDPVRGGAARLVYDNAAQIMRMLDGAWFASGQNEFRGCDLIYDLDQEQLSSGSSECGEPVVITIVPRDDEDEESESSPSP